MGSLVLVPWAETAWSEAGRLSGHTALPLSDVGQATARRWASILTELGIDAVLSSDEQTSVDVALIISASVGATHKMLAGLTEVDIGLWDGLTNEELLRRYPKIFKAWKQDPSSASPPEGETVDDAVERLAKSFDRLTAKYVDRKAAIVLGPLAFGLIRCQIEEAPVSKAHTMNHNQPLRYELVDSRISAGPTELVKPAVEAAKVASAPQQGNG